MSKRKKCTLYCERTDNLVRNRTGYIFDFEFYFFD